MLRDHQGVMEPAVLVLCAHPDFPFQDGKVCMHKVRSGYLSFNGCRVEFSWRDRRATGEEAHPQWRSAEFDGLVLVQRVRPVADHLSAGHHVKMHGKIAFSSLPTKRLYGSRNTLAGLERQAPVAGPGRHDREISHTLIIEETVEVGRHLCEPDGIRLLLVSIGVKPAGRLADIPHLDGQSNSAHLDIGRGDAEPVDQAEGVVGHRGGPDCGWD
jgi:hypothetical protein